MKRTRREERKSKIRCICFCLAWQLMWMIPVGYAYHRDYVQAHEKLMDQEKIMNAAGVHLHIQDEVELEDIVPAIELETEETTADNGLVSFVSRITAYCPCEECSDDYGDMTSTGGRAKEGRTIAVDPKVIPYGSVVIINGHEYTAEDCGGEIKGTDIDIYFDTHSETYEWGVQYLEVQICQ